MFPTGVVVALDAANNCSLLIASEQPHPEVDGTGMSFPR